MKTRNFFLVLFLGLPLEVCAQHPSFVYSSFFADRNGIFWARHFDLLGYSSKGIRDYMLAHLKKNPFVRDVKMDTAGNIIASLRDMKVDFKKFGIPFITTSNKVSYGRWKGKIKIEFADDRYQIIVKRLEYFAKLSPPNIGKAQVVPHRDYEQGLMTDTFLNQEKSFFKRSCLKDLDLMNFMLLDQISLIEERLIPNQMVTHFNEE